MHLATLFCRLLNRRCHKNRSVKEMGGNKLGCLLEDFILHRAWFPPSEVKKQTNPNPNTVAMILLTFFLPNFSFSSFPLKASHKAQDFPKMETHVKRSRAVAHYMD